MSTHNRPWLERDPDKKDKQVVEQGDQLAPLFGQEDGLIPAIVTEQASREILMFAWLNRDALELTLASGYAHFWSRSRENLWKKGEESGNLLAVKAINVDCDQDVLHIEVAIEGNGVACHTGAKSCFYRQIEPTRAATGRFLLKRRIPAR